MSDVNELDWIKIHEPWRLDKKSKTITSEDVTEGLKELSRNDKPKEWDYLDLTKIKGIGEERAKDLGRIYKTEGELINALRGDNVPLRNDIVKLLKEHFNINKN